MAGENSGCSVQLWRAFGEPDPPSNISQEAHERDRRHLRRLARLRPGDRADPGDLHEYANDLRYAQIQDALLVYLLPFCLQAWREDFRQIASGYGGFVEHFYPTLADRRIFEEHLAPRQAAAVSEFMRESILEEIDEQRGLVYRGAHARPYRWIGALTTYGVLLPDIEVLWSAWWSLDTIGRAIAAVQYASCLIYPENENPIFAPWNRDAGGGPPCLWEFQGHLYTHRWLQPNVDFLKKMLTPDAVKDLVAAAERGLVSHPEQVMAEEVNADIPLCIETLESRCAELPRILATVQEPGSLLEWSR